MFLYHLNWGLNSPYLFSFKGFWFIHEWTEIFINWTKIFQLLWFHGSIFKVGGGLFPDGWEASKTPSSRFWWTNEGSASVRPDGGNEKNKKPKNWKNKNQQRRWDWSFSAGSQTDPESAETCDFGSTWEETPEAERSDRSTLNLLKPQIIWKLGRRWRRWRRREEVEEEEVEGGGGSQTEIKPAQSSTPKHQNTSSRPEETRRASEASTNWSQKTDDLQSTTPSQTRQDQGQGPDQGKCQDQDQDQGCHVSHSDCRWKSDGHVKSELHLVRELRDNESLIVTNEPPLIS